MGLPGEFWDLIVGPVLGPNFLCKNRIPAMTGKIDDPIDASYEAYPEDRGGLGERYSSLALSFSGLVFLPAAILKILTDQFLPARRFERIEYLLSGLRLGIKGVESRVDSNQDRLKEVQAQIEAPRFQEAVAAACEEAARATNKKKIERMVEVLTGSLTPTRWSPKDEDIATLIRDLVKLGDRDIEVLDKLGLAFGGLMLGDPKLPARLFTDNNAGLDASSDRIDASHIDGIGGTALAYRPIHHSYAQRRL
jgi:hypothetical protein